MATSSRRSSGESHARVRWQHSISPTWQSELARETLTVVDATDCLYAQGQARAVLAEVLAAGGGSDAAVTTAEDAASIFERKGLKLLAERARAQIEKYRRGEPGERAPLGRA